MHHGFIKVAVAVPEIKVGDCGYNKQQIIALIKAANQQNVKLLVFPELCVTGSTCGDLFFQSTLINGAKSAIDAIARSTVQMDIVVVVGCPINKNGRLFNCGVVIKSGEIMGYIPKNKFDDFKEFPESRYFSTMDLIDDYGIIYFGNPVVFKSENFPDFSFGVTFGNNFQDTSTFSSLGANIVISLSAFEESISSRDNIISQITYLSKENHSIYLFANAGIGESTSSYAYSGNSFIAEEGKIIGEIPPFETGLAITEVDVSAISQGKAENKIPFELVENMQYFETDISETTITRQFSPTPFVPQDSRKLAKHCEKVLQIQSQGLAKRIRHTGVKSVVIGISGGLDSTLALIATVKAMELLNRPNTDIITVSMPCFGTSERTKSNAQLLCEKMGTTFKTIDITDSVTQHFKDIEQDINNYDVVYENSQARERTQVLMDLANKFHGIVIGTGDMSELALGWATFNGDHMSMYGMNSSIPKTLISHIILYFSQNCDESLANVLKDIVYTPVSPELIPTDEKGEIQQKTEDIIGPYQLHDFFLYYLLNHGFSPSKIFRLAEIAFNKIYSSAVILSWMKVFYKRFFAQQFKRSTMPEGIQVGTTSLTKGKFFMPSDAVYSLWLEEIKNI